MSTVITITQLESKINVWRNRKPAENGILCREAAVLADLYGEMIYLNQKEKLISDCSNIQIEYLTN